jgi:hypothetical protein
LALMFLMAKYTNWLNGYVGRKLEIVKLVQLQQSLQIVQLTRDELHEHGLRSRFVFDKQLGDGIVDEVVHILHVHSNDRWN